MHFVSGLSCRFNAGYSPRMFRVSVAGWKGKIGQEKARRERLEIGVEGLDDKAWGLVRSFPCPFGTVDSERDDKGVYLVEEVEGEVLLEVHDPRHSCVFVLC